MAKKKRRKAIDELYDLITGFSVLLGIYVYFRTESIPLAVTSVLTPVLVAHIVKAIIKQRKTNKLKKSGISDVDNMDGFQFENYLAVLFKNHGYKVKVTKSVGDFGADLVIIKNGIKTVVQAKCYSSKVGIKAIQEITSALRYYNATNSMVITNNYFTNPAIVLAKANEVELINRDMLIEMLLDMNPNGNVVDAGQFKKSVPPMCPKCKNKMVLRRGKNNKEFYGCSVYPQCNGTISL